jgi:hypothetical protein
MWGPHGKEGTESMLHVVESPPFSMDRRGFMRLTGAAGLGLALTQLGTLSALAQSNETVADIINIAATAEALAVSLTGAVIAGAAKYDGGKGLSAMLVTWVKGIQAEEQAHYQYLIAAGAKPLTTTFTVPQNLAGITNDSMTLLHFVVATEGIFIGAYIAAAQEFTDLKQPALAKVALQIGAVEGEHRALARLAQGDSLPHNVAFESAQFATLGDAANALKSLGFIGGTGTAVNYADFAGKVDNSGMTELTPGGVAASTTGGATTTAPAPASSGSTAQVPAQMPNTGGGGMAGRPTSALVPAAAVVGGLVMAGIGLRNRRSAEK